MALTILIYSLICYGICNTIIFSHGPFHCFDKMHEFFSKHIPMLEEMTSCFICLPWWCGFVLSALNLLFIPLTPLTPMNILLADKTLWYVIIFFDGAFTTAVCWLINTVQECIERTNSNE